MGLYDMAVGKKITSAFSGPADVNSFDMITHVPSSTTIKAKVSTERQELEILYQSVRNIREEKPATTTLKEAFGAVSANHPNDWLLCLEIPELVYKQKDNEFLDKIINHLELLKVKR